jgi:hypothetical protein
MCWSHIGLFLLVQLPTLQDQLSVIQVDLDHLHVERAKLVVE